MFIHGDTFPSDPDNEWSYAHLYVNSSGRGGGGWVYVAASNDDHEVGVWFEVEHLDRLIGKLIEIRDSASKLACEADGAQ